MTVDIEDYEPVDHENTVTGNPQLLETFGPELEQVKNTDEHFVWTLLEGSNGDLVLVAGFHVVDRLNYLITRRPWVTGEEEALWAAFDDSEDGEADEEAAQPTETE